ncbi:hypothetical protein [Vibrio owensii]|uniref:hypothetical protein n=1 Tax=Vibrio owensii TaxID=696485 RepID=UPI0040676AA7
MTQKHDHFEQTHAPVLDREDDLLAGSLRAGMLNQLLREQLMPTKAKTDPVAMVEPQNSAQTITLLSTTVDAMDEVLNAATLDRSVLHDKLSQLFHQQKAVYEDIDIEPALRKRQFITHCGLVMSPDNCITTQLDDLRVRAYVRAVDKAITAMAGEKEGPVHVVYPACGPFAPLLMPLLGYYLARRLYSPQQLKVTFIDMQPGAFASLEALAEQMGVNGYIRQNLCIDALSYDPGELPVDIVVLEAMQHGFSREGHFGIARYFASLLQPDGILLPQQVIVTAALNDPNREFVAQWQDAKQVSKDESNAGILAERIELGEVARINRDSLNHCKERVLDEHTTLIEFGKVQIPYFPEDTPEQVLLMCSEVQVFEDEWVHEYDSGITHPLPDQQVCINFTPREVRPGDLLVSSGDAIQFYYRINGLPGFLATWMQGDAS